MKIVIDEGAYCPEHAFFTDAGFDLRTPIAFCVPANGSYTVDTGVHIELPPYSVGFIKSKSGLNIKHNITTDGVINVGYTGSIRVKLYNHGTTDVVFSAGQKIAQLVILPIMLPELEVVDTLAETERGDNGFGSTGV